jgi:hypothetical protein
MKKLFAILLILSALVGCKKYNEGPSISLRTKKARVANTWTVESYTMNGTDYTSALQGIQYTQTFEKDGNYSFISTSGSGEAQWEFQNDKDELKLFTDSAQSTTTLIILRLKEKEFWYYYYIGSNRHELHMKGE